MSGTSDRLRAGMAEEAQRLAERASGYNMAGEAGLGRSALVAAAAISTALHAIDQHQQRVAAATASLGDQT